MHKPRPSEEGYAHKQQGERRQFALVLRPTPACPDEIKALRFALKGLLRRHGLRCVSIAEIPPDGHEGPRVGVTGETSKGS
jgi:hypothetical protein